MFWSGLHVALSKTCNFGASGCVWVGLTRCGVEKLLFSGIGFCLSQAYTWRCRNVIIFRHRVVFRSGLHVVVSKTSNFQASSYVWVALTHGGVEKE